MVDGVNRDTKGGCSTILAGKLVPGLYHWLCSRRRGCFRPPTCQGLAATWPEVMVLDRLCPALRPSSLLRVSWIRHSLGWDGPTIYTESISRVKDSDGHCSHIWALSSNVTYCLSFTCTSLDLVAHSPVAFGCIGRVEAELSLCSVTTFDLWPPMPTTLAYLAPLAPSCP
jgi:hypothetical protein